MARKGRKTRWRKLPIPIGNNQGEASCAPHNVPNNLEPEHTHTHPSSPLPKEQVSRVTFNEDEYTKITTPRQDMLFKKGYLSKKRPQPPEQQTSYTSPEPSQSPSDSVDNEQYVGCDDTPAYPPPFVYPSGYMDPNGLFYINGGSYEVYDPYSNSVTVIVGPGGGYPGQPVLTAVPCHPMPLQPIEWFNPPPQHHPTSFKKRNSTDSQNWGSSQSCESPSSGHELEPPDSSLFYPQPQYVYPGYMFGAPLYNINGVSVEGAVPPPPQHHQPPQHASSQSHAMLHQHLPQPADQPKRRKKRRKRRRPGMGDDGSESSCEEVAGSGVSSDAGQGSSCSKTTDSGIHTGADSPQPQSSPVPAHNSPLPDVSTEEEPSQSSISQIPCITLNNHVTTDSSTEDETNPPTCDPSPDDGLVASVENLKITNGDEKVHEVYETAVKEEEVNEQTVKVAEIEVTVSSEDKSVLDNEEEMLPKSQSDEEVNTEDVIAETGSEIEVQCIEENLKSVQTSSPEKSSHMFDECLTHDDCAITQGISSEKSCSSPEEVSLSPEKGQSITPEEIMSLSFEEVPSIPLKDNASLQDSIALFSSNSPEESTVCFEESILPEFKEDVEECIAEETGYSEEGWGSAEETSVEERWAMAELGEEVTVDKPITEAVTRWLESQGTKALVPQHIESEDEGIKSGSEEDTCSLTGPKNVKGNPCLVQYPSTGTRVADISIYENEAYAWRAKCDPLVSVDRYYRLGADLPPSSPAFKTATAHPTLLHIDPTVPFPCGLVCCILQ